MKKCVLYSSNTKKRSKNYLHEVFPKWSDLWDAVASKHRDIDLTIVIQLNTRYFLDISNGACILSPKNVHVITLDEDATIADFVQTIMFQNPDIVVAMPQPISGFDWNGIRDATIADILRDNGIKCLCYSVNTAINCFDKCKTYRFLRDNGFCVSEAVCIDNDLFVINGQDSYSTLNAYRESILWEIKRLGMPVIIKPSMGSGSMGIHISHTYEDVRDYLFTDILHTDLIVEKLLTGDEYGLEIHGVNGNYIISPPYRKFSSDDGLVNDPLGVATLKYGPILNSELRVEDLRLEMRRLAETMGFTGIFNIDLFFADDQWYILDINSRWSGITSLVTTSQGRSVYDVFVDQITGTERDLNDYSNWKYCCQFKIAKSNSGLFGSMVENGDVTSISCEQILLAGERKWYNDAVSARYDSLNTLLEGFAKLRKKYPEVISEKSVKALKKNAHKYLLR